MTQQCPLCDRSGPHQLETEYDWFAAVPRVSLLSKREREVLLLLAAGLSNIQIARRIGVVERTVKSHIAQIMLRLQVESRLQAGLVAFAYQLIEPRRAIAPIGASAPLPSAGPTRRQWDRRGWNGTEIAGSGAIQLAFLVVLGTGGARLVNDAIPVSTLVAFLLYVVWLTHPVMLLVNAGTLFQAGRAAVRRIREVTRLPVEAIDVGQPVPPGEPGRSARPVTPATVSFDDVWFTYPGRDSWRCQRRGRRRSWTRPAAARRRPWACSNGSTNLIKAESCWTARTSASGTWSGCGRP
jgi:DNA-binding CsgD family transcriptional regulator